MSLTFINGWWLLAVVVLAAALFVLNVARTPPVPPWDPTPPRDLARPRRRHPVTPQPVHDCPLCHNNPGSDTAREQGCQCPVLDNDHGHTNRVVVNLGCPVHGRAYEPERTTP